MTDPATDGRAPVAPGWTDYPKFRRVEEIGRDEYERVLFSCVPPDDPQGMVPSDYIWLSLMAWCPHAEAARVPGGLCLRMPAYHGDKWLTALIGRAVAGDVAIELLEAPELGGSLHHVPKWLAGSFIEDERMRVELDRDNFDYIRDVQAQLASEGGAFNEIRRRRRQFGEDHPRAATSLANEAVRIAADDLLGVFDSWAAIRDRVDDIEVLNERCVFERLLTRDDLDRCFVLLLQVEVGLTGFSIDEVLPDATAICHFRKIGTRTRGAWEFLNHAVYRHFDELGVHLQNFEQDLGVPGLRQRKMNDRPAFMLETYVVTRCSS